MGKETLGRYEVVGELAQYRVGTVIKATDPKTKQTVALKTFRLDSNEGHDQELLKRFRAEAEEARALSSPNIVAVVGTGEDKGVFFAVLEFVDGIRIFDMMLSKKEMSTNDIVDISRQVCSALDHAASKKIVHRNLKPGNVMIEWDGSVKIMDYGVPSGVEVGAPGPKTIPQLLYYMAPEQIQRAAMDVRSNIFNWGAMLYELISGKKAAAGETREEICKNILSQLPPPLSQVVPGVPPGINHVVMKALAKNPFERYQTGAELINDIEHYKQFGAASAPVGVDTTRVQAQAPPNIARPETFAPPIGLKLIAPPPTAPASAYAANPVTSDMMTPRPTMPPAAPSYGTFTPSVPPIPMTPIPLAQKPSAAPQSSVAVAPEPIPGTVEAQPKQETKVVHPLVVAAPRNKPVLDSTIRISTPPVAPERSAPRVSPPPVAAAPVNTPLPKPRAKAQSTGFDLADRKNQMIAGGAVLLLLIIAVLLGLQFGHNREDVIQPAAGNAIQTKPEPVVAAPAQLPAQSPEVLAAEQQQPSDPEVVYSKKDKKKKTAVKPVAAPAPSPATGEITITSIPTGAQVQIDGRTDPAWVTPYGITVYAGPHSVVVSKPGFSAQSQNVEVLASNRAVVSMNLSELVAMAAITSDPAGASIYVDGRDSGKVTPAQFAVGKGTHTINLKRLGYFEASQSLEAMPGQTTRFAANLKPMGDATEVRSTNKLGKLFGGGSKDIGVVKIKTNPKGAQISINNRMMDRGTPAEFAIPPGNYEIVLSAPGYKPLRKMITLQSGDRLNLDEVLEK